MWCNNLALTLDRTQGHIWWQCKDAKRCNSHCCKRSQERIFFSLWQPTLAVCISIFDHRAICPHLVYLAILKWNKLCIHPASYMLIYAFDLVLVTVELILSQGSKVRFPPWISIRPSRGTVGAFMHFTGRLPGRRMVAEWMRRLWSIQADRLNLPNGQAQWLLEVKKRVSLDY